MHQAKCVTTIRKTNRQQYDSLTFVHMYFIWISIRCMGKVKRLVSINIYVYKKNSYNYYSKLISPFNIIRKIQAEPKYSYRGGGGSYCKTKINMLN